MTRIAADHAIWPSASTRTTCDPARRSRTASGVTPAGCRSMNTRAPCGAESIRNEPTNDSFCVVVAPGVFVFSTCGGTAGSFTTTRIARSAIDEVSGAAGATGAGAGGIDTGSGRRVIGSARGCSDEDSHEIRMTHTIAPNAEPDANDHSPRRFLLMGAEEGVVCAIAGLLRPGSARRTIGRKLGRLLGVGRGVAGLIDAGRSLKNSSSGSVAQRPLRS